MSDEFSLAASSIAALVEDFRAVAQNLANINTSGYKRICTAFSQVLASQLGVQATPAVDFTQGALARTGRPLDLGLEGKGFFVIETPTGPLYTRNGGFCVSPTGQIVDVRGRTVAGEGGPITLPGTTSTLKVQVSREGVVSVDGRRLGKLRLVEFADPSVLQPVGGGCFAADPAVAAPAPAADTTVHQGFREGSNASPIQELVRLITLTRAFQSNFKSLETQDDRLKSLLEVAMGS